MLNQNIQLMEYVRAHSKCQEYFLVIYASNVFMLVFSEFSKQCIPSLCKNANQISDECLPIVNVAERLRRQT